MGMVNILTIAFCLLMVFILVETLPNVTKEGCLFTRNTTDTLKGISVLMIFLSHIFQYTADYVNVIGGGYTKNIILGGFGTIGVAVFFFLSGYGNYLSLVKQRDNKGVVNKTISHIMRLITIFIISFMLVSLTRIALTFVLHVDSIQFAELAKAFINLDIVDVPAWYLKVQIYFYFAAAIAFVALPTKYVNIGIFTLAIAYILSAKMAGLPMYWWQTAMCFPVGCLCAQYKDILQKKLPRNKKVFFIGMLVVTAAAYLGILISPWTGLRILSIVVISVTVPILCSMLQTNFKAIMFVGKASLPIYLIHAGLAGGFLLNLNNINLQIFTYTVMTVILSLVCYYADKSIAKHIDIACKKAGI